MNKSSIVVIGSTNTDMVIKTTRLPSPGETVLSGDFFMNPGGKGANQAVAAARLGGSVTFVTKTGKDLFASQAKQLLEKEGIATDYVFTDERLSSGVALIMVDQRGENCIAVASGANASLSSSDIEKSAKKIIEAELILLQLEISIETVVFAAELASSHRVKVILNPAPAQQLPANLLKNVHTLTPNRKEAGMLTGITIAENDEDAAMQAAVILHEMGPDQVIITLGSRGALLYSNGEHIFVRAPEVHALDSTAAGDVFNGALAVAMTGGQSVKTAVTFACKAAALSVTRLGAQASAPYLRELDE
jgi:ribokinase